jgi:DNA polymerase-1
MITLIDSNNILHRLHHIPALQVLNVNYNQFNDDGTPMEEIQSGVFYGFLNVLNSLFVKRAHNEYFVFVWDDRPHRKMKIFPSYKYKRIKNDSFAIQKQCIKELINVLDIKQVQMYGEEADDVIATLAIQARRKGHKVIIYSQDHDFEQLISSNVFLKSVSGKGQVIKDVNWVLNNRGCHPNLLAEIMQITGDDCDDVPGANGVGLVTATNLIKANGSLRVILRDTKNAKMFNKKGELIKIRPAIAKKIEDAKEQIVLNKELVVLNTKLDVSIDWDTITKMNVNVKKFLSMVDHFRIDKSRLERWLFNFTYKPSR